MSTIDSAQLLAIVEVDQADRVQCQQPGCGHTVWKAVHVVRDAGSLLVLGSTCFAKRYGGLNGLGSPSYGSGSGRKLTPAERALLAQNTQALLAQFEAEKQATEARMRARLADLKRLESERARQVVEQRAARLAHPTRQEAQRPGMSPASPGPWPWMKPSTSMAYFRLTDGTGWVRVQRRDGQQMLVPLPAFEGWDEALPTAVGTADQEHQAYLVPDIARAIAYLRQRATSELVSGVWTEIQARSKVP